MASVASGTPTSFKIVDISKEIDRKALKPGEIGFQLITDPDNLPDECKDHPITRVIRDKDDNIISISHPDAGEMGSATVGDVKASMQRPINVARLYRGIKILCFVSAILGVVFFELIVWLLQHWK